MWRQAHLAVARQNSVRAGAGDDFSQGQDSPRLDAPPPRSPPADALLGHALSTPSGDREPGPPPPTRHPGRSATSRHPALGPGLLGPAAPVLATSTRRQFNQLRWHARPEWRSGCCWSSDAESDAAKRTWRSATGAAMQFECGWVDAASGGTANTTPGGRSIGTGAVQSACRGASGRSFEHRCPHHLKPPPFPGEPEAAGARPCCLTRRRG